eukprot:scaffold115728_cov67-Phaeocystis_antarctica.AAC.11
MGLSRGAQGGWVAWRVSASIGARRGRSPLDGPRTGLARGAKWLRSSMQASDCHRRWTSRTAKTTRPLVTPWQLPPGPTEALHRWPSPAVAHRRRPGARNGAAQRVPAYGWASAAASCLAVEAH